MFAQFVNNSNRQIELSFGQPIQAVQQHQCNALSFTVFSQINHSYVVLALTAVQRNATETLLTNERIDKEIQNYDNGDSQDILDFPVYLELNLLSCPAGFEHTQTRPYSCDCNQLLRSLPDVTCDIEFLTIQRSLRCMVRNY